MFKCAVKRAFQVVAYLSAKLKRGTSMALRGHIVGQILTFKPRFVPIIPGPNGAGHTNDWCIMQKRFKVLVHYISPHRDLSTIEIPSCYLLYMKLM